MMATDSHRLESGPILRQHGLLNKAWKIFLRFYEEHSSSFLVCMEMTQRLFHLEEDDTGALGRVPPATVPRHLLRSRPRGAGAPARGEHPAAHSPRDSASQEDERGLSCLHGTLRDKFSKLDFKGCEGKDSRQRTGLTLKASLLSSRWLLPPPPFPSLPGTLGGPPRPQPPHPLCPRPSPRPSAAPSSARLLSSELPRVRWLWGLSALPASATRNRETSNLTYLITIPRSTKITVVSLLPQSICPILFSLGPFQKRNEEKMAVLF